MESWQRRGGPQPRTVALVAGVAASAIVNAAIALPVLGADRAAPVIAVNEDVGETIGWPSFVTTIASVHRHLPDGDRAVILTAN